MKKVTKAVIPAAGLGTRFLPATKAIPKEMLPIFDKPAIQYIVEEAIASGIKEICIVVSSKKKSIQDHFDRSIELEKNLNDKGKKELLTIVEKIDRMAEIRFILQEEPLGLGHAIYCANDFVQNEPFAVLLGDEIFKAEPPCLQQLMGVYDQKQVSVVGAHKVSEKELHKYAVAKFKDGSGSTYRIRKLIEKPKRGEAPSNYALIGRYIITPTIFSILGHTQPGKGGEIQLTDALDELAQQEDIFGHFFEGKRFDVGDKLGYLMATIEFALEKEDIGTELKKFLKEMTG